MLFVVLKARRCNRCLEGWFDAMVLGSVESGSEPEDDEGCGWKIRRGKKVAQQQFHRCPTISSLPTTISSLPNKSGRSFIERKYGLSDDEGDVIEPVPVADKGVKRGGNTDMPKVAKRRKVDAGVEKTIKRKDDAGGGEQFFGVCV